MKRAHSTWIIPGCFFLVAPAAHAAVCNAGNAAELTQCLQSDTDIRITADIMLDAGERFVLNGLSNVSIDGAKPNGGRYAIDESQARFFQTSEHFSHYIRVLNSSGVEIRNIEFRSTPAGTGDYCAANAPGATTYGCSESPVVLINSSNLGISGNSFNANKATQLSMASINGASIQNNAFTQSATYGLWIGATSAFPAASYNLTITNNVFTLAGANGIMLSAADTVWIGGNDFTNNHRLTQFSGFGGGQLVLEESAYADLSNVSMTGNVIRTTIQTAANGIEFANFNLGQELRDVLIRFNRIEANPEHAIVVDRWQEGSRMSGITILDNEFVNNRHYYGSQVIAKAYDSFALGPNYTESPSAIFIADFADTAKTCVIPAGASACTINIKWNVVRVSGSNFVIKVREATAGPGTKTGRGHFAAGIDGPGSQDAPWIGRNGAIFELYLESDYDKPDGWEAPVASILVKGI